MHRVLSRLLGKIGIDPERGPSSRQQWQALVQRVGQSYEDADLDRHALERSLAVSSQEMEELYGRLQASAESRLARERDKLRAANAYLQALYDASPDMIFLHDEDGTLVDVNDNALQAFGYTREQMLDLPLGALMGEGYSDATALKRIRRVVDGEHIEFEWVARRRDGQEFPVEVRLRPLGGETRRASVLAVIRDISEPKRAQEELRLAATAFDTHEGIFITDNQGAILRVNQAFTRISGYQPEEILGKNPRMLRSGHHDDAFYEQMWRALVEQGRWHGEIWNRRKSGDVYPEWLMITAVQDEAGQATHYVAACVDLSELKAQQQRIERTAAEEQALSRLLRLSLEQLPTERFLQQALDTLLDAVPWLSSLPKGGMFVHDPDGPAEVLRLVAGHDLSPQTWHTCRQVAFGTCVCGKAAQEGLIHFADCTDWRHEIHHADTTGLRHYSVPIMASEKVLGVMVLYLPAGHSDCPEERAFLARVADVISMGIQRRLAEAEIEYRAYHDPLTGLPNRRLLMDRLEQLLTPSIRHGHTGALLFIDLDHFKTVNDSLGHEMGDELLRAVGARLRDTLRQEDTAARLGGDEFVVMLPEINDIEGDAAEAVRRVAGKIQAVLSRPFEINGKDLQVTPSVGIALFPSTATSANEVLKQADTAMYRAKESGRNTLRFFLPSMQTAVEERLLLQNELRLARARAELELYFQPQVDAGGRVIGAEALLRWRHPQQGMIAPVRFISLAEETGLIHGIGEWVLVEACRRLKAWTEAGFGESLRHVAVNVSPRQFHQREFVSLVQQVLQETGADPARLVLELTENVVLGNVADTIDKMKVLGELGIGFSIDDFGTGYSSLSYLARLPLDILKIDQSFVRDLRHEHSNAGIVEAIVAMAGHLDLEVIAEGVETEVGLQFLKEMGCRAFQGYYFSKPVPAQEFTGLLLAARRLGGQRVASGV